MIVLVGSGVGVVEKLGVPRASLGKYLRVLEEGLGLVAREYPLGMEGKPRYARYRIVDLFFETWFSLLQPVRHLAEANPEAATARILGEA